MSGITLEKRIDNTQKSGIDFLYESNKRTIARLISYSLDKGYRVFATTDLRSIRVTKPLVSPPTNF